MLLRLLLNFFYECMPGTCPLASWHRSLLILIYSAALEIYQVDKECCKQGVANGGNPVAKAQQPVDDAENQPGIECHHAPNQAGVGALAVIGS